MGKIEFAASSVTRDCNSSKKFGSNTRQLDSAQNIGNKDGKGRFKKINFRNYYFYTVQ